MKLKTISDCGFSISDFFHREFSKSAIRNRKKSPLGDLGVDFLAELESSDKKSGRGTKV